MLQRAVVRGKSVDERRIAAIDVMNDDLAVRSTRGRSVEARPSCLASAMLFARSHPMLVSGRSSGNAPPLSGPLTATSRGNMAPIYTTRGTRTPYRGDRAHAAGPLSERDDANRSDSDRPDGRPLP